MGTVRKICSYYNCNYGNSDVYHLLFIEKVGKKKHHSGFITNWNYIFKKMESIVVSEMGIYFLLYNLLGSVR